MFNQRAAAWTAFCALQLVPVVVPILFDFGMSFKVMVEAWWLAQVALLVLWVSLGSGWLSVRYLIAAFIVVYIDRGLHSAFDPQVVGGGDDFDPQKWDEESLIYVMTTSLLLLLAVFVVGMFRNIWRWRFAWLSHDDFVRGGLVVVEHKAMSFRFVRNLIRVAVVCLFLFVGAFILGDSGRSSPATFGAGYYVLFLPVMMAVAVFAMEPFVLTSTLFAICAMRALGINRTPLGITWRCALVSVALSALAGIYGMLDSNGRTPIQEYIVPVVLPFIVLVASLLLMRAGGYRLVRGTRLVVSEVVPVDSAGTTFK